MTNLYISLQNWFAARKDDERGATMVEYGLMVAIIAVVCVVAITAIGVNLNVAFVKIKNAIPGA